MKTDAYQRAEMPSGTNAVLDQRSLEASNANLLTVLRPGQRVLDVGCGSGAITAGIAALVGADGLVTGIDRSAELIGQAQQKFAAIGNLHFEAIDILGYAPKLRYDVITTARTLQWIAEPSVVIQKMIGLLGPEGVLCVLDYNHALIEWEPEPPKEMRYFYECFLRWRSDAGMYNDIVDRLPAMVSSLGLRITLNRDESEYRRREDAGFPAHAGIWTKVAETRGNQMVSDGYVTEEQRLAAIDAYTRWCGTEARSMRLYLRAVHAQR
ncbi:MAG: class I SAM-dependent methyltransferase [Bacteroidetes bacterium]|nr:class I SAM-dependent methyltransferase [Bacteroidota bacterium]